MIYNMLYRILLSSFKSVLNETSIYFTFTQGAQRVVKCMKDFSTFSYRRRIKLKGMRDCEHACAQFQCRANINQNLKSQLKNANRPQQNLEPQLKQRSSIWYKRRWSLFIGISRYFCVVPKRIVFVAQSHGATPLRWAYKPYTLPQKVVCYR